MAHTCPDCGALCYCNGDIDDIDFGEDCEAADCCVHYQSTDCCASADDFEFDDSSNDILNESK